MPGVVRGGGGLTSVISPNSSQSKYKNGRWTEKTYQYLPVTQL